MTGAAKRSRGLSSQRKRDWFWGYVFVLPAVVLICLWVISPMLEALRLSFMNFKYLTPEKSRWVGMANYLRAFGDAKFGNALLNTVKYSLVVVPVQTAIAFVLAMVCNARIRGKQFFRVAYYIPSVTSAIAVGTIFKFLFNKQGLVNNLFAALGMQTVSWFDSPQLALPLCMIMAIWASVGGQMLVLLTGLQDIPNSVLEAAEVDGANTWQRATRIVLPMLAPTVFFVLLTGMIGTLQVFDQAYIVSRGSGGPLDSTMTAVLYIYNLGFRATNANMGYPSALAFILFLMIFVLTLIQRRFFDGEGSK